MELMEFTTLARDANVIKTAKLAFQQVDQLAVIITADSATAQNPPTRLNTRYFLAAYMIVFFHLLQYC